MGNSKQRGQNEREARKHVERTLEFSLSLQSTISRTGWGQGAGGGQKTKQVKQ